MWTSGFYRYEYIKVQFENILERKLCNGFGQLLLIYQKMLNMELNMMF